MKTFIVLFSLCFIGMIFISFSFTSCNKTQRAEKFPVPPAMKAAMAMKQAMKHGKITNAFPKTAGKLFSRDTLNAWIAKYKESFKTISKPCSFNSNVIKTLCDTPDAAGVMFYNINIQNNWGLIAIGVNSTGQLMKSDSVQSSGGILEWENAMELVSDYQAAHANGIWGEFFGTISLENFIAVQNVQNILIQIGLNSKGPRFIITNDSATSGSGMEEGLPNPPYSPK